jgi:hypothetical protein
MLTVGGVGAVEPNAGDAGALVDAVLDDALLLGLKLRALGHHDEIERSLPVVEQPARPSARHVKMAARVVEIRMNVVLISPVRTAQAAHAHGHQSTRRPRMRVYGMTRLDIVASGGDLGHGNARACLYGIFGMWSG